MSKRQRSVLTAFVLTGLLIWVNVIDNLWWKYRLIGLATVIAVVMTIWSMREVWKGLSRVMTLILPLMLMLGAAMFTFLLPEVIPGLGGWFWGLDAGLWIGWVLRILFWGAYGFAVYFLLLTENIFAVSAIRTIPLVRAASVAGYLLTLVSAFFLYYAILSFRLPYYYNFGLIGVVSFPLVLQSLWSVVLEERIRKSLWFASLVLTWALMQFVAVLSLWQVSVGVVAVLMTVWLYVLLGICQQWIMRKLFMRTVWEYVSMGIFICMAVGVYYWAFLIR